MSKFATDRSSEGWEFASQGSFVRKIDETRVNRKKFSQAKQQAIWDEERSQSLTEALLERYEREVLLDPLTELLNTRTFLRKLSYEVKRAKRYKRPLSLLVMSIDRLGHYSHTYSEMIVDDIFKALAVLIKGMIRDVDIAAHLGRDYFAVICPETYAARALSIGERIWQELNTKPLNERLRNVRITTSIGVASFPANGRDENDLLLAALNFHDQAQRQGGNQVQSS